MGREKGGKCQITRMPTHPIYWSGYKHRRRITGIRVVARSPLRIADQRLFKFCLGNQVFPDEHLIHPDLMESQTPQPLACPLHLFGTGGEAANAGGPVLAQSFLGVREGFPWCWQVQEDTVSHPVKTKPILTDILMVDGDNA